MVLEQEMPQLSKFLNNECRTGEDCRLLRQEVAQKLTENFWYTHFSGSGIATLSEENLSTARAHPIPMVKVLLHQLGVAPIYFSHAGETNTQHRGQTWGLPSGNELLCAQPQSFTKKQKTFLSKLPWNET